MTPAEVKEFIPVNHNQYNATIDRLIDSVTRQVESYIRRDLLNKRVKAFWYKVPQQAILPRGPHTTIESVVVEDGDGNEKTLVLDTDYRIEGMVFKRLYRFQEFGKLTVTFISGYEAEKRPPEVAGAILQEIALQFKNRQDPDTPAMTSVNNLSLEARHLLSSLVRLSF